MRYRYVVTIDSDHEDAVAFRQVFRKLLNDEGFDPDECLAFEFEHTSWEPVHG